MKKMTYNYISKEQLDEWVANGTKQHQLAMERKEEKENNPPECPETCEFKTTLLETPKEEFEIDNGKEWDIVEKFLREDLFKVDNIEIKLEIEKLEQEKDVLINKINFLYSQLFTSLSDIIDFDSGVLDKVYGILKCNPLENLKLAYGSRKKE